MGFSRVLARSVESRNVFRATRRNVLPGVRRLSAYAGFHHLLTVLLDDRTTKYRYSVPATKGAA